MKSHHTIVIAGAGGIAEAVGLILAEWSAISPTIYIGDRSASKAGQVASWIKEGTTKPCTVESYQLHEESLTDEMRAILEKGDILLDCLPGTQATRMAGFALQFGMHYCNLTEYVVETDQIIQMAENASTGFVLQTGLAPGYIDLLAHGLFQQFCKEFKVSTVDRLEMKVGALTTNATAPHYYGFTWSTLGVATEYIKDAMVIRDFKKTSLPSLSERAAIIINGISYEEDLTSGGAADLSDALEGKVQSLDYKTLRHPGHYAWVEKQVSGIENKPNLVAELHKIMTREIPHLEDDQIVLYAAVQGKDSEGILRRKEVSRQIFPQKVGRYLLRAIQVTTAAPLAQAAQMLLESDLKGTILQSQIDPVPFLNGNFIVPVYGKVLTQPE